MARYFIVCFVLISSCLFAQQTAVTQTGEQVVLYNDGRWEYVTKDTLRENEIRTNPDPFVKKKSANFLLKSSRIPVGFWIDNDNWSFVKKADYEAAEYELDHKSGSLYGLIITEHLDVPLLSLANIALQNARDAAPDIKVIEQEFRNVNGTTVLMMRMVGTIQDIRFSYFGYYFSGSGGSTQFLVYTSEDYMAENLETVQDLLNGFVQTTE